jgi:hypothetical protein
MVGDTKNRVSRGDGLAAPTKGFDDPGSFYWCMDKKPEMTAVSKRNCSTAKDKKHQ